MEGSGEEFMSGVLKYFCINYFLIVKRYKSNFLMKKFFGGFYLNYRIKGNIFNIG